MKSILVIFVVLATTTILNCFETNTEPGLTSTPLPSPTTTKRPNPVLVKMSKQKVNEFEFTSLNFSIPKGKPTEACLKVIMMVSIDIDYLKINETEKTTKRFYLDDYNDYDGVCNSALNTLEIRFRDDWMFKMNYTLVEKTYQLDAISLEYTVDSRQFPNASANELGKRKSYATNFCLFSTQTGNSFKCKTATTVKMRTDDESNNAAVIIFQNYHGQPFMSRDKSGEFGTAVECIGDRLSANKLMPIIVGSVLAALVLVIVISYIVGQRKHINRDNPVYQSV